ncbi:MAG: TetR/AcrR family transcriptional regulator [Roseiflexaceae bacterium]
MNEDQASLPAAMRRRPQRTRGQQRVSTILDAAEQIFAEIGYEEATTNQIAAYASTSIGSLYQFFPNKGAILHAVAERYRVGMIAMYDALVTPEVAWLPLTQLSERLIQAMLEFGGAHIGFSRIILQAPANTPLGAAASTLQHDLIDRLDTLLAARAPWMAAEQRVLHATVGLTAVNALLSLMIAQKTSGKIDFAHALMGQANVLLVAYLQAVTAPASRP